jgi:hypothetical protein
MEHYLVAWRNALLSVRFAGGALLLALAVHRLVFAFVKRIATRKEAHSPHCWPCTKRRRRVCSCHCWPFLGNSLVSPGLRSFVAPEPCNRARTDCLCCLSGGRFARCSAGSHFSPACTNARRQSCGPSGPNTGAGVAPYCRGRDCGHHDRNYGDDFP